MFFLSAVDACFAFMDYYRCSENVQHVIRTDSKENIDYLLL